MSSQDLAQHIMARANLNKSENFMTNNVLFKVNRTTHNSKTLLCVVRFNVNKTLLPQHQSTNLKGPESGSIEIPPIRPKFTLVKVL